MNIPFLLLCFLQIYPFVWNRCLPIVEFERCFPSKNASNLYWNLEGNRPFSVSLVVKRSCGNSIVNIRWVLVKKDTKTVFRDMNKYNNKQIMMMDAYSLPIGEYILLVRVKEHSSRFFGNEVGYVEKQCWIRVIKDLPRIERIAPRENLIPRGNGEYTLLVETNTAPTGWTHCSNPNMFILVSPTSTQPADVYFGEVAIFDKWVNARTQWVMDKPWRWIETKSISRTWSERLAGQSITKSKYGISQLSTRRIGKVNNNTGHVVYPTILNGSFPRIFFFDQKGREIDIITGLQYNKKYRFLLCLHDDIYSSGCTNASDITTCPNYALSVSCEPDVAKKEYFSAYSDVIGMKCNMTGKVPKHLTFGVYSMDGKKKFSKGPADILIGHFTDYKSVYFRLYVHRGHTVNIRPIEYETHVRFSCKKEKCKKSIATFKMTSDVVESANLSMQAKLSKLIDARDGKLSCKECNSKLALADLSFSGLVSAGKLGNAVQLGLILLKDLEKLIIKDTDRNEFQAKMLDPLTKIKDWTWPHLEMMVGFLPYFNLEGVPKELGHTKRMALLIRNIVTSMKKLIVDNKFPITLQVNMEKVFFPVLYRQISQILDAEYVKPFIFKNSKKISSPPFHGGRREDYEDYSDEVDESIVDDYYLLTNDALEALSALLFSRSKTHHYKEEHLEAHEKTIKSLMWLEFENIDFLSTNIDNTMKIKLGSPVPLPPKEQEFRFIWSLIDKNAFYWHNESHRSMTNYLYFQFYSGDKEKTGGFEENPVIQMQTSIASIPVQADGILVPSNPDEWTSETMDRFIRVYRIKVDDHTGHTLAIFITNICPVERLMVIVDQSGNKPRLADFLSSTPIIFNKEYNSTFVTVDEKGYWYIAVLPYREDVVKEEERKKRSINSGITTILTSLSTTKHVETSGINYMYSLVMYSCPVYVNDTFSYDACTVRDSSTISRLDCECKEIGGPVAAGMAPVPHKLYGIVDVPLTLELTVEYVIIISTLIAIFLYCFFLVICPYRGRPAELIYFLSDNAKTSRFGYLIRVSTTDFIHSGTTAKIGIQLYGTNSNSKRHILNYPDPDQKLFRTASTDHFLLATNESLGNINRLEIWSDCSGTKPEWNCESIRVYDIQRYISWYFSVQKKFCTRHGFYCHYYVKPTHPSQLRIRTPWVYFNLHYGANHTWNIVDSTHDQYWSYFERLTVILTHILGTFALTLYFVHPPIFEYQDGIGVNHENDAIFFIKTIAIVTAIVAPVNYLFAAFLRGSIKSGRYRSAYGYFPSYYSYLTLLALFVINILCLTYCLVYGPFISAEMAYDWLATVCVSLLINIFICENLFLAIHGLIRLAFYYLNAWVESPGTNYIYKTIITDVESQRKFLYQQTDKRGLRPYLTLLYQPLTGERMEQRRMENKRRASINLGCKYTFRIWATFLYLMPLLILIMSKKSAFLDKHLEDVFVEGKFTTLSKGIHDVYTYDSLYEYLNTTLVEGITPVIWYFPYFVADSGLLVDINNKFIGNVRIRQRRALNVDCPYPTFAKEVGVIECIGSLTEEHEMKGSMYNETVKHNLSMWWYHEEAHWNTYRGFLRKYDGDGYTITVGKTRENALYRVRLLKDNGWLDEKTKFVIIEMLLYNANTGMFADVKLSWEREANYMYASHEIQIVRLLYATHIMEIVAYTMFAAVSARILITTIQQFFRRRWKIFKDWHNLTLLAFSILIIYGICLFFIKNYYLNQMLDKLTHADRTAYLPYSHVVYYHRTLEIILAVMAFIATLLLLQFVQFMPWTSSIILALRRATPMFLNLIVHVVISLMVFAHFVRMFYGGELEEFNCYINSSVFFLMMYLKAVEPGLWGKMYATTGSIIIWFYVTVFVTIWATKVVLFMACAMSFRMCKKEISTMRNRYTLIKYIQDISISPELKNKTKIKRPASRIQGGQDESESYVFPAPDTYRYRNSIYLQEWTMKKQQQVTTGYLRNNYERHKGEGPTKLDLDLMRGIAEIVIGPKELREDLYYEQRIPFTKKTTTILVADEKMQLMARIVERMLDDKLVEKAEMNKDSIPKKKEVKKPEAAKKSLCTAKPKPLTEDDVKSLGKSQIKQLQGLVVILDISNDVIDTVAQKLFGPFPYLYLLEHKCCADKK